MLQGHGWTAPLLTARLYINSAEVPACYAASSELSLLARACPFVLQVCAIFYDLEACNLTTDTIGKIIKFLKYDHCESSYLINYEKEHRIS